MTSRHKAPASLDDAAADADTLIRHGKSVMTAHARLGHTSQVRTVDSHRDSCQRPPPLQRPLLAVKSPGRMPSATVSAGVMAVDAADLARDRIPLVATDAQGNRVRRWHRH